MAAASLLALGWGQAALAETADGAKLEEIVVTARKKAEPLQTVPAAVSALSGAQLAAQGISDTQGIVAKLPSVTFSGGIAGALQGQICIRGICTLTRNIGVETGVGFYVDGVYLGRSDAYNQELIDIDRVEVLRGPQGTLFGKNTIAGVFNITTLQPTDHATGELRLEAGNYNLGRLQAYAMGPLSDTVSAKLSIGLVGRNGIYSHLSGGAPGDRIKMGQGRAALYFHPGADDELVAAYDLLIDRSHPAFFQVTSLLAAPLFGPHALTQQTTPLTIDNNKPDSLRRTNHGGSLSYTHHFTNGDSLTAIAAYRHNSYRANLDDDQNQIDFLSTDTWGDVTKLFTGELRYSGKVNADVTYLLGAFYANQNVSTNRAIAIGDTLATLLAGGSLGNPPLTTIGSVKSNSYAGFANVDWRFSPGWLLSAGLRLTQENKNANFVQGDPTGIFTAAVGLPNLSYSQTSSNSDLSPTASLSYTFAPDVMAYLRVAKGFKSASFNIDLVPNTGGLFAGPESATTYEGGVKSEWLGRRLRLNLAGFVTKYNNLQVSQLLGAGVTLNNAGKATISGIEGELAATPTPWLRIEAGFSAIDPKYDQYQNCGVPKSLGGGVADCSGKQLVGAARFTGRLGAQLTYPVAVGSLVLRADLHHESPVYFEATNSAAFRADAHTLIDLRAGIRTARWELFVWGKNIGDVRYVAYKDDRSGAGVLQTTAYGDPRSYGVTLSLPFR